MRVFLPPYLSARTIYSVIGQVLSASNALRSDRFSFDFSPLVAAEPAGIAAFSALVEWLRLREAVCILAPGTCPPHEPAALTLRRIGFFPRVLRHPVSFSAPPDARWMPLTAVPRGNWGQVLMEDVIPWIARQAGISRFAVEWNLSSMVTLLDDERGRHPCFATGRVDPERGRLELAIATLPTDENATRLAHVDGNAPLDRLLKGLSGQVVGWFALHEGWHITTSVPEGHRRIRSTYPAPVAYPGQLFDLVIDLAPLSGQAMLNEPTETATLPYEAGTLSPDSPSATADSGRW